MSDDVEAGRPRDAAGRLNLPPGTPGVIRAPGHNFNNLNVKFVSYNERRDSVVIEMPRGVPGYPAGTQHEIRAEFFIPKEPAEEPEGTGERTASGRLRVGEDFMVEALGLAQGEFQRRIKEKGDGTFASRHEAAGAIHEELIEFWEAIHGGTLDDVEREALDVAVGCIFLVACKRAGTLEW